MGENFSGEKSKIWYGKKFSVEKNVLKIRYKRKFFNWKEI